MLWMLRSVAVKTLQYVVFIDKMHSILNYIADIWCIS